jgi:hypothetical protein
LPFSKVLVTFRLLTHGDENKIEKISEEFEEGEI